MVQERPIVAEAVQTLRAFGVTGHREAIRALKSWMRCDELTFDEFAVVAAQFVRHPHWCARPCDEIETEIHISRRVPCDPAGTESVNVGVSVCQHWSAADGEPWVALWIDDEWYPLPRTQARTLLHCLRRALEARHV